VSKSPRRREILRRFNFKFEVIEPSYTESILDEPVNTVRNNAISKVKSISDKKAGVYVGVDTIVYVDGIILGKPNSAQDAIRMLKLLSGKWHSVYSGLYLYDNISKKDYFEAVKSEVLFDELSDDEIRWYVSTGEPLDKAGGYGVQGLAALFIKEIKGCYYNIVGFPLNALYRGLKKLGYDPFVFMSSK